jgi:hypothetical protein
MKFASHIALFYVAFVISFIISALLGFVVPPLASATSPLGKILSEPVWLLEIMVAFAAGVLFYVKIPSPLSFAIGLCREHSYSTASGHGT